MAPSPINPAAGAAASISDSAVRNRAGALSIDDTGETNESSAPAPGSQEALNLAILESTQVSLGAKSEPLALVLKAAIEGINERLAPSLGANALQAGLDSGVDISPEATAERIVSQSTGFFAAFQQQNQDLDPQQQLDRFLEVIGAGIESGFAEARDILDSLQVLQGEVEENIDLTFDLVQTGLEGFREEIAGTAASSGEETAPA